MNLPQEPDLLIEKDADGIIRELRHLQTPAVADPDVSAKRAAFEYLRLASRTDPPLLPLSAADLDHLDQTTDSDGPGRSNKSRFRWSQPRELKRNGGIETTVVWCQQTIPIKVSSNDFIPDVRGGSIRLVAHYGRQTGRWQITSARSTLLMHANLSIKPGFVERTFRSFDPEWADSLPAELISAWLGPVLGLVSPDVIADGQLVAYHRSASSTVYEDGGLGLAASATVFMSMASGDSIAHRILFDPLEARLIRKAPIASACAGYAFLSDPDSKTGAFDIRPDSGGTILDQQHDPVALADLDHAGGGRRRLSGPRVKVRKPAALGPQYDPPEQVPPFAFSARTNEFAAVSAYCHCDSMMRLVEGFGFDLHNHFHDVKQPLTVDHRAKLLAGSGARDGRGMNAYVTPFLGDTAQRPWNVAMLFALADLSDTWKHPLGLVADVRFVWHEFCHVLILAATGSTEFDFAHSAGDALGAIMCDPASKLSAPWRGVTFPFVQLPLRRHDRKVEQGWGWSGTLYEKPAPTYGVRDPAGYNSEQILSSTLFRLYCAAGGDAVRSNQAREPDLERRRAAAYHTAYLIVRAIASLGAVETEPTGEASQFATALMDADVGTPDLDYEGSTQRGGMLHKVVRWTFEQQGLYQTSSPGQNRPGSAPPIDIYVDDGRKGQYQYSDTWSALPAVLWVQHSEGDSAPHETPRPGYVNYVYVILRNRGTQPADGATVSVFAATDDAADVWNTASTGWELLDGDTTQRYVPNGASVKFGPFRWTPQAGKRNALLVRATVAGDRSNIDTGSTLPCATGPVVVADLVRADNNLGYREWTLS
ncbi:hypothetical protein ACKWRH_03435 [Bradyrhizobium sp. Pa8]|uniref:hypothetical protein n=1 Tax=Bradyrhizobium sp. Pa8 TaxID=3386552 RepID=UPI00403FBF81